MIEEIDLIDTYKSLCTEFYDLDKPIAPPAAMEYYLSEARNSAKPILEPMCGSGRFLIPILEHGFDIDGTDASREMLNSCRKKCAEIGLSANLHLQKLQELSLPRNYGLIIIPAGSFGLITAEQDNVESLRRLFACLIPGGQFIVEILTSPQISIDESISKREVNRKDSTKILLTTATKYDAVSNMLIMKCDYQDLENEKVRRVETEFVKLKPYRIQEFSDLLISTGFSEIDVFRPYSKDIPTEQDDTVLFKCKKPTG